MLIDPRGTTNDECMCMCAERVPIEVQRPSSSCPTRDPKGIFASFTISQVPSQSHKEVCGYS
jgi:hypothetical protein